MNNEIRVGDVVREIASATNPVMRVIKIFEQTATCVYMGSQNGFKGRSINFNLSELMKIDRSPLVPQT